MTQPVIFRKSNHVRKDGWEYPNEWAEVHNILKLAPKSFGNYLFKVDEVIYHSRTREWEEKLSELQIWSKLQNV